MSGVNDGLITRLRAEATMWNSFRGPSPTKEVLTAAADALEAAQAVIDALSTRALVEQVEACRAERDAEAVLADGHMKVIEFLIGFMEVDASEFVMAKLTNRRAAHRERRTKGDG